MVSLLFAFLILKIIYIVGSVIIVAIILYMMTRMIRKLKIGWLNKNASQLQVDYLALGEIKLANFGAILGHSLADCVVTACEIDVITTFYSSIVANACALWKKYNTFRITPPTWMVGLINDYNSIHQQVRQHNEMILKERMAQNREFFDSCLEYPLDEQQRRAIVSEEDNCLVVSSAGSGKTSSIVGKVKYLIERKGIDPQKILLISYTNKSAAELTERVGVPGLRGYTFHKLALDLIGQVTHIKPSICDKIDALFIRIYHELLRDKSFQEAIIKYFVDYQVYQNKQERSEQKKREELSQQKQARIKALLPDMDGNNIYVKSMQESTICFVLSSLGVKFRYEEPYEYVVADEMHSQYKPDFSLYYEKGGQQKRIYLEHFAVDEHEMVPSWFAKEKGISYEEANKKYGDGITWKRNVHEKYGTTLLETSSADFHYQTFRENLCKMLAEAGVPLKMKTEEELYAMLLPKNSQREKAFIRLVVTFAALLKSSCKSIQEIMSHLNHLNDERSIFVIKRIFQPAFERYIEVLNLKGEIDFTDAIIWATKLCQTAKCVSYSYIIVDEFQDISIDRYLFLKALREGNPPAKLFCVGDDWQSIYRFSGSDMLLFSQFSAYFGPTEINNIETTYRFGEPLVSLSSQFIERNGAQISKSIRPHRTNAKTGLYFCSYEESNYCGIIDQIVATVPSDKSILLLGRYSFDDCYLSGAYKSVKENGHSYYVIGNRRIEFLTVHKSKGLEADYVIILQCNKDIYGFPSMVSDDPVLEHLLTKGEQFPYAEERRLFYVAITRARIETVVLYDRHRPSVFVNEFMHPDKVTQESYVKTPNANKRWTPAADRFLLTLYHEGKSIKEIAEKMGRSRTAIIMRLGKLGVG